MSNFSLLKVVINNGIPEVSVEDVKKHGSKFQLIDVRRPDEYVGELAHIKGAKLVTLGPDLMNFLNQQNKDAEIIFICRSGARSGQATLMANEMGIKNCVNMTGGMIKWNEQGFEVEK